MWCLLTCCPLQCEITIGECEPYECGEEDSENTEREVEQHDWERVTHADITWDMDMEEAVARQPGMC